MPALLQKDTTHHLRDGEVVIAKRPNTSKWQYRIKRPKGDWEIRSTKTADLERAKQVATERYDEMRFLHKHELPLDKSKKFNDVASLYLKQLTDDIGASTGKAVCVSYASVINTWILPFFEGVALLEVDEDKIYQYEKHVQRSFGRTPAKTTINTHNVTLRAIFDLAARKKWIQRGAIPKLTVKGKGIKTKRRPHFKPNEWNKLTSFMNGKWQTDTRTWLGRYKRQVLRIYVLMIANTGMRPGGEPLNLKWKHVQPFKKPASKRETFQVKLLKDDEEAAAGNETYLRLLVSGKTAEHETEGYRSVIARHGVKLWLDQLAELTGRTDDEDYLFCLPDGSPIKDLPHMFTQLITDCNLLRDTQGNRRTLYSLRHTYATYRIIYANAPYEILALQMGTSVNMIEQHYSHLKVEDSAAMLAS